MTTEKPSEEDLKKLRVRIAELCGWSDLRADPLMGIQIGPEHALRDYVPDYIGSLDAMHDAEKLLTTKDQKAVFGFRLEDVMPYGSGDCWTYREIWHAEAWQRAMALICTLSPEPIL